MMNYARCSLISIFLCTALPALAKFEKCEWMQTYLDVKIESCSYSELGMTIAPKKAITRAVAVDMLATALIASDMQKLSLKSIAVFRDPSMKSYVEITGTPLRFPNTGDPKKDHDAATRLARDCKIVDWEPVCKP